MSRPCSPNPTYAAIAFTYFIKALVVFLLGVLWNSSFLRLQYNNEEIKIRSPLFSKAKRVQEVISIDSEKRNFGVLCTLHFFDESKLLVSSFLVGEEFTLEFITHIVNVNPRIQLSGAIQDS
jgi:hypothetical protein